MYTPGNDRPGLALLMLLLLMMMAMSRWEMQAHVFRAKLPDDVLSQASVADQ